jgi:hypothetical protein
VSKKIVGYQYETGHYILDDGTFLHPIDKIEIEDEQVRRMKLGHDLLIFFNVWEHLKSPQG